MYTNTETRVVEPADPSWERRLNDIGWGLLFMLTGGVWLLPPGTVPAGTWLFGVAAILLGINAIRWAWHIHVSGFAVVLGLAALIAAISQMWRTDPPLMAIFLVVIGGSLVLKPLLSRTT